VRIESHLASVAIRRSLAACTSPCAGVRIRARADAPCWLRLRIECVGVGGLPAEPNPCLRDFVAASEPIAAQQIRCVQVAHWFSDGCELLATRCALRGHLLRQRGINPWAGFLDRLSAFVHVVIPRDRRGSHPPQRCRSARPTKALRLLRRLVVVQCKRRASVANSMWHPNRSQHSRLLRAGCEVVPGSLHSVCES
jgi:hypothetical protein